MNSTVQAAITDPSDVDNWNLDVEVGNDFAVTLTDLPGDYEVTVYGPDGSLIGNDSDPGTDDKSVRVTNAGLGTYQIVVDSASGDSSNDPYTLVVAAVPVLFPPTPVPAPGGGPTPVLTPAPLPTPAPFNSYGTPLPVNFLPY